MSFPQQKVRTLIVDNYDSFTFNLYQLLATANGEPPVVVKNDADWLEVRGLDFDNIVLSPGPGRPERRRDFGICRNALDLYHIPTLGVCLGHQGIGALFGARVVHAPEAMHGRLSPIYHDGADLLEGLPQGFSAVRYHSLMLEEVPRPLQLSAWTADGVIMALRHPERPLWGVQFHPESISTEYGRRLLDNFRRLTLRTVGHRTTRTAWPRPAVRFRLPKAAKLTLLSRKLDLFVDPEDAFAAIYRGSDPAFWLDSSTAGNGRGRFSFMGDTTGPHAFAVEYDVDKRQIQCTKHGQETTMQGELLPWLDKVLASRQLSSPELPFDFNCGFVGYLGYELKADCSGDRVHRSPDPDAQLLLADRIIAFDHVENSVWLVALASDETLKETEWWLDQVEGDLRTLKTSRPWLPTSPRPLFELARDRETYYADIEEALCEIGEGESYEICLTNQLEGAAAVDPLEFYRLLRRRNPAPHSAFLRFGDMAIACSSPEQFLRVHSDRRVESRPIKGTARRDLDPEIDLRLTDELRRSEKDRAENLMIVDLVRNDFGAVCEPGSVHVPKLMDIESFANVHHMVSTIRGRMRAGITACDVIRSSFPGGSMTGAPKVRTMQIIDRLEGKARGVYSGTIGYLGLGGGADLNIVIRTAVFRGCEVSIGTGGAIVALSEPEAEIEEALLKASLLTRALEDATRSAPSRRAPTTDKPRAST